jgi:hypothetical protein
MVFYVAHLPIITGIITKIIISLFYYPLANEVAKGYINQWRIQRGGGGGGGKVAPLKKKKKHNNIREREKAYQHSFIHLLNVIK